MTLSMAVDKATNLANTTHEEAVVLKHPVYDYYLAGLYNQVKSKIGLSQIVETIQPTRTER